MGCSASGSQALLLSELDKLKEENVILHEKLKQSEEIQSQTSEELKALKHHQETYNYQELKNQFDITQTNSQAIQEKNEKLKAKRSLVKTRDIIGSTTNSFGRTARVGASGKYYCGGPLNTNCGCCDGSCGPTTGCNCSGCMELDLAARCLPSGYLVNKEGRVAKLSSNGNVYCGSKVMNGVPGCDGWCGPNSGPQCSSCRILQSQWSERYCKITWG